MHYTKGLYSICTLSFNHAKFIRQAIGSYIDQDYSNIEIIALDDGSSDNSVKVLEEMAKTINISIKIITQPNSGCIGKNFNKLFENASGEFITFISLDDMLIPNTVQKKINILQSDPNAAFVAPSMITRIDEFDNIQKTYPAPIHKRNDLDASILLELVYTHTCAFYIQGVIFRRDIIEKVNGFDDDMVADDLVLESKIFKYMKDHSEITFHILDEPGCYYRVHSSNVHKIKHRQLHSMLQYYKTWWPDREVSPGLLKIVLESIEQTNINAVFQIFYFDEYMKNILCNNKQVHDAIAFAYEKNKTFYGARYKKIEIPLFKIEKYKDIDAGKKYVIITILGLKIVSTWKYVKK